MRSRSGRASNVWWYDDGHGTEDVWSVAVGAHACSSARSSVSILCSHTAELTPVVRIGILVFAIRQNVAQQKQRRLQLARCRDSLAACSNSEMPGDVFAVAQGQQRQVGWRCLSTRSDWAMRASSVARSFPGGDGAIEDLIDSRSRTRNARFRSSARRVEGGSDREAQDATAAVDVSAMATAAPPRMPASESNSNRRLPIPKPFHEDERAADGRDRVCARGCRAWEVPASHISPLSAAAGAMEREVRCRLAVCERSERRALPVIAPRERSLRVWSCCAVLRYFISSSPLLLASRFLSLVCNQTRTPIPYRHFSTTFVIRQTRRLTTTSPPRISPHRILRTAELAAAYSCPPTSIRPVQLRSRPSRHPARARALDSPTPNAAPLPAPPPAVPWPRFFHGRPPHHLTTTSISPAKGASARHLFRCTPMPPPPISSIICRRLAAGRVHR